MTSAAWAAAWIVVSMPVRASFDPGEHAKRVKAFVAACDEFGITRVSKTRTVEEFGKRMGWSGDDR